jgi:hypothetical protein
VEKRSHSESADGVYRIQDAKVLQEIRACSSNEDPDTLSRLVALADAIDGTLANQPPWRNCRGPCVPPSPLAFPVANVLVRTGEKAVPGVICALAAEEPSSYRAVILRYILVEILGKEEAARRLRSLSSEQGTQDAKDRLIQQEALLQKITSPMGFAEKMPTQLGQ